MDINLGVNTNQTIEESLNTVTTTVNAGGVGTVTITPPEGLIGRITSLYINVPLIGSSGSHFISIYVGSDSNMRAFTLYGAYNVALNMVGFGVGTGTPTPSTDGGIASSLGNLRFDSDYPLNIRYNNNTNANQTNNRIYNVQYVLEGKGTL